MHKTQIKDAVRNINKKIVSFLSICLIVALGVGGYLTTNYIHNSMVRQAADFTIALTVPENERANPLGVTERAHFTKPAGTLKMITGADRGAVS